MTNAILITNLSKSYGETVVFRDFSARLPFGETTVITGVSGGGKTTLLRLILGLETPDGGEIAGVPARRAAVFQEDRLCPQLTALENVLLTAGRKKEREARDILARLGLGESLAVPAAELSGGMRRRLCSCPPAGFPAGKSGGWRCCGRCGHPATPCCWTSRSRGWTRQTAAPPWTRCAPSPMTKPFYLSPTTPPKPNFSAETGFLSLDSAPFPR